MQIKTIMRHHFMLVRMVAIKKSTNNKCWRRCGEKGTLLHCWWECKLVQPLWRFLKTLETELAYDPAIPLQGIHTKETRTVTDSSTLTFIASLFTIARTWKQPRCPLTDEWIRKLWYMYIMEYYPAIKKEHIWVSSNKLDETGAYYRVKSVRKRNTNTLLMYVYGI